MSEEPAPQIEWPRRLLEACQTYGVQLAAGDSKASPGLLVEPRRRVWVGLRDALARYLRFYARRFPGVDREDIEDLASKKSLELLQRIESHKWKLADRTPTDLAGFLSAVARNALVNESKRGARLVRAPDLEHHPGVRQPVAGAATDYGPAAPDAAAQAAEFTGALRECVGGLRSRSRAVWFFRVFYELSSRHIAEHPRVRLTPEHVDVVMQRARDAIRSCMEGHGFAPADMPVGAFAALWELLDTLEQGVMEADLE